MHAGRGRGHAALVYHSNTSFKYLKAKWRILVGKCIHQAWAYPRLKIWGTGQATAKVHDGWRVVDCHSRKSTLNYILQWNIGKLDWLIDWYLMSHVTNVHVHNEDRQWMQYNNKNEHKTLLKETTWHKWLLCILNFNVLRSQTASWRCPVVKSCWLLKITRIFKSLHVT